MTLNTVYTVFLPIVTLDVVYAECFK